MQTQPIIQCHQIVPAELAFDYTGNHLNLALQPGQIISLIGPNYSGKTNWLRTMCGVEEAARGHVSLLGMNTDFMDADDWATARTRIGYIPFDFSLLSAANSIQNVVLAARYHQIGNQAELADRAGELLHQLDPQLDVNELPAYLRKDQQYKVAIARALMLEPKALVLDSPFAFFDSLSRQQLQDYLLDKVAQGLSIVQISHDIPYVLAHSSQIIFTHQRFVHTFTSKQAIIDADTPEIRDYLNH
ncbi:MAG TPA: ATP-binding cassette domain-containing protein [Thiotrichales bacterium]|nr:ATP-binding cassette domain-containing protein [Thiotrichales bacterium]